jgi:hypothetical protein
LQFILLGIYIYIWVMAAAAQPGMCSWGDQAQEVVRSRVLHAHRQEVAIHLARHIYIYVDILYCDPVGALGWALLWVTSNESAIADLFSATSYISSTRRRR